MIRSVFHWACPKWVAVILAVSVSLLWGAELSAADAKTMLKVTDPNRVANLVARGGRVVENYGSFQLVEIDSAVKVEPSSSVRVLKDSRVIKLNNRHIDTSSAEAQAQVAGPTQASTLGKKLQLVQFAGPIKPEWVEQLRQTGTEIVAYVPNNAYLIYGGQASLASIRTMALGAAGPTAPIVWQGDFLDSDKLQIDGFLRSQGLSELPNNQEYVVQMVVDDEANAVTISLANQLRLGDAGRESRLLNYRNINVALSPAGVASLAARPDVVAVMPRTGNVKMSERQSLIISGNLNESDEGSGLLLVPKQTSYMEWLRSKGFNPERPSDFVVDVTDSGIDDGTNTHNHLGLRVAGGPTNASRVVYNVLFGTQTNGGNTNLAGCDGHGNLDAHIIAGYAAPQVIEIVDETDTNTVTYVTNYVGFPYQETNGYYYGLGVAPFVRVGSSVIFAPDDTDADPIEILNHAHQRGARISANSWGARFSPGVYSPDSQKYDALVRDARLQAFGGGTFTNGAARDQQMIVVFAAGNDGDSGSGTVSPPATAKNVITVGASENVHPFANPASSTGRDGSGVDDTMADNADSMADFSSRGPASDGRHKPDLVAPGTHITGGAPRQKNPDAEEGALDLTDPLECFDGSGVSGGTRGDIYYPAGQTLYTASSGTSQATPAVAGAAALIFDKFKREQGFEPSPAFTKAYLMNSARYLTSAGDDLWSNSQGMGLVDLGRGFDDVPRLLRDQDDADRFTSTGQRRLFAGQIADTNQPVRITLAWTDAPGDLFSRSQLKNDLNLIVYVNCQRYYGNSFSGPYTVEEGEPDTLNNVESLYFPPGTSGEIVIEVEAADINSDGVPQNPAFADQDFALVAYNFDKDASVAVLQADGSEFVGETNGVNNGFVDIGETVTFDFGIRNIGSVDTTDLVGFLVPSEYITVVTTDPVSYGVIKKRGVETIFGTFTFMINEGVECGSMIPVEIYLEDAGVPKCTIKFEIQIGYVVDAVYGASNPQRIVIRDYKIAAPSPSTTAVDLELGAAGRITATLHGFNHTKASDVVAILESPSGKGLFLLNNNQFSAFGSVDITFDDTGAPIAGSQFGSATFHPDGSFAPVVTGFVLPSHVPKNFVRSLAELAADGVEGNWSLHVFDTISQGSGEIAEGWTLGVVQERAFCNVTVADLVPFKTTTPARVVLGDTLQYTIIVTNWGPNPATNVFVVEELAPSLAYIKSGQSQGTVSVTNNQLTFAIGAVPVRGSATMTVTARSVLSADIVSKTRVVVLGDVDPIPENNETSVSTLRGRSAANSGTISFSNDGPAPATIYPSTLAISGVTGVVSKIEARIAGLNHSYARDLEVLLVGPGGQKVILMSDCGPGSGIYNTDLLFSDSAATVIPPTTFSSGVYRPTDNNTANTTLASPAPSAPYSTALSVFNGVNPNGTWSLYVYDKQRGGTGIIAEGWGLDITLGNGVVNDLAISQSLPASVLRDRPFSIGLSVTNLGPTTATAIYVTNVVSPKLSIKAATPGVGTVKIKGSLVIWTVGSLSNMGSAKLMIDAIPVALGVITNSAVLSSPDSDPVLANNVTSKTTVSSLAPGLTESPDVLTIPTMGAASIYPSVVMVSNLVDSIQGVIVTINGLSHTFPKDLDILLVGPTGQKVMLMSDAGIGPVNGINLVFDDSAPNALPQGFLRSGTFTPKNFDTSNDLLAAPAPAAPYATSLSAFKGTDGNGAWKLFVYDHATGDGGAISGGWKLNISTEVDAPRLKIGLVGTNVVLSWPITATAFRLQASDDGFASWQNFPTTPVVIGNEQVVTTPLFVPFDSLFFRLIR